MAAFHDGSHVVEISGFKVQQPPPAEEGGGRRRGGGEGVDPDLELEDAHDCTIQLRVDHGKGDGDKYRAPIYLEILRYRENAVYRQVVCRLSTELDAEQLIALAAWMRPFSTKGHAQYVENWRINGLLEKLSSVLDSACRWASYQLQRRPKAAAAARHFETDDQPTDKEEVDIPF